MTTLGAKEYGTALYSLAKEEGLQKDILQDLNDVCAILKDNASYVRLLQNPCVKKEDRLGLIDGAFKEGVNRHVLNFCKILCEKSALNILEPCKKVYKELMYEESGILPVTAVAASELNKQQCEQLVQKLNEITGKTVELETTVDKSLIGGIKLVYSGKEVDGSALSRLESMQAMLLSKI